jgi:uncharacterized membrane protein
MQNVTARTGNPALREGLTFGIGLGVVETILSIIDQYARLGLIMTLIELIVAVVAFWLAGSRASRQTGSVGTGAVAGLLTGLISAIITFAISMIFVVLQADSLRQAAQNAANQTHLSVQYTNGMVIGGAVVGYVILAVLLLAIGAAVGAIAGAVSRNRTATV